jgi:hypothetical protein
MVEILDLGAHAEPNALVGSNEGIGGLVNFRVALAQQLPHFFTEHLKVFAQYQLLLHHVIKLVFIVITGQDSLFNGTLLRQDDPFVGQPRQRLYNRIKSSSHTYSPVPLLGVSHWSPPF